jgi:hypothetical protein
MPESKKMNGTASQQRDVPLDIIKAISICLLREAI